MPFCFIELSAKIRKFYQLNQRKHGKSMEFQKQNPLVIMIQTNQCAGVVQEKVKGLWPPLEHAIPPSDNEKYFLCFQKSVNKAFMEIGVKMSFYNCLLRFVVFWSKDKTWVLKAGGSI